MEEKEIQKADEILAKFQLKREKEDLIWNRTIESQHPGSTLIVNGRSMHQPGPKITTKIVVEYFGTGSILDKSGEKPLLFFNISISNTSNDINDFGDAAEMEYGLYSVDELENMVKEFLH